MEEPTFSEALATLYQWIRRHIPEDLIVSAQEREIHTFAYLLSLLYNQWQTEAESTFWFSDLWHGLVTVHANISEEYSASFFRTDILGLFFRIFVEIL